MKTPRASTSSQSALKAVFWLILFAFLAPIQSRAEWVTFGIKVPLPYVDESFYYTVGWNGGYFYEDQGEAAFMGISVDTDDPSFPMTISWGEFYATLDAATVQSSAGSYISLVPQLAPGLTPNVRVLAPPERASNSMAIAQLDENGTLYNSTLYLNSFVLINGGYYPKFVAPYNPSRPFWIVDLTASEKAPQGAVDLRTVNWEPDTPNPLVPVTLFLDWQEIGHGFKVYSWANNGPVMAQSVAATAATVEGAIEGFSAPTWTTYETFDVPPGSASLTFSIGIGMSFYVERDADGVVAPPGAPGFTFVATPGNWSVFGIFPDPPNRVTEPRTFRVHYGNRGDHNFTVCMTDGYNTSFTPSYEVGAIDSWDDMGLANPLSVAVFTAWIDPTKSWWLRDDTTGESFSIGQTDVLDGWTPLHNDPPLFPELTLRVPWWHAYHPIQLYYWGADPGSDPSLASWYLAPGTWENDVLQGVNGFGSFTIQSFTFSATNPRPYEEGLTLVDHYDLSYSPFITVYPGKNDLRLWLPHAQPQLMDINETRFGHELVLRHPNGTDYPILPGQIQGDISYDENGDAWFNSWGYFNAETSFHPELPWYVEDRSVTPPERIGPNLTAAELLNWVWADSDGDGLSDAWEQANGFDPFSSSDATLDSDGDGVRDAWEIRNGRNRNSSADRWNDTDHDGMRDDWEIQNGLDPLQTNDADADPDGDGLKSFYEYILGSHPLNPRSLNASVLDGAGNMDGDGQTDRWEVERWLNPRTPTAAQLEAFEAEPSELQEFLDSTIHWDTLGGAAGGGGSGSVAAAASGTTPKPPTTPESPQQQVSPNWVTNPSTSEPMKVVTDAKIRWTNVSTDAQRVEIWRGTLTHSAEHSTTAWEKIHTANNPVPGTTGEYVDPNLEAGRRYLYRVRAWNQVGYSRDTLSDRITMHYEVPVLKARHIRTKSNSGWKPAFPQFSPPTDGSPIKYYLKRTMTCDDMEFTVARSEVQLGDGTIEIREGSGSGSFSTSEVVTPYPSSLPAGITGANRAYVTLDGDYTLDDWDYWERRPGTVIEKTRHITATEVTPQYGEFRGDHNLLGAYWTGSETRTGGFDPGTDPWSGEVNPKPSAVVDFEFITSQTSTERTISYFQINGRFTKTYTRTTRLEQEYDTSTFRADIIARASLPTEWSTVPLPLEFDPWELGVSSYEALSSTEGDFSFLHLEFKLECNKMSSIPLTIFRIHDRSDWSPTGNPPENIDVEVISDTAGGGGEALLFEDKASEGTTPRGKMDSYLWTYPMVSMSGWPGFGSTFVFGCQDAGNPNNLNYNAISGYSVPSWVPPSNSTVVNPYFAPEVIRGMIVPFAQVSGTQFAADGSYIVTNFDVFLRIAGARENTTTWDNTSGPSSGTLQVDTPSETARYANPKKGGVYKFTAEASTVTTGLNLVLPLAGAEVLPWLATEVPYVIGIAGTHQSHLDEVFDLANDATGGNIIAWNAARVQINLKIGSVLFDYTMDPVNRGEGSPTPAFQNMKMYDRGSIDYPYLTLNGVVVHGARVNYILLVNYLRAADWAERDITTMGNVNQFRRSGGADSAAAASARDAGYEIFRNQTTPIDQILTKSRVRTMQDANGLDEEFFWPASSVAEGPYSTSPSNPDPEAVSLFIRPRFFENYLNIFTH